MYTVQEPFEETCFYQSPSTMNVISLNFQLCDVINEGAVKDRKKNTLTSNELFTSIT